MHVVYRSASRYKGALFPDIGRDDVRYSKNTVKRLFYKISYDGNGQLFCGRMDREHFGLDRHALCDLDIGVVHLLEAIIEDDFARYSDLFIYLVLLRKPNLVEDGDHQKACAIMDAHLDYGKVTTRSFDLDVADLTLDGANLANLSMRHIHDVGQIYISAPGNA